MIEIDTARYARVTRGRALKLLEAADLAPDKFTAHRNGTFTAKYKRDRQPIFASHRYEERMEDAGNHDVAILKRPSPRIDRGPYITLKFAMAAVDRLGLHMEMVAKSKETDAKNGHAPTTLDAEKTALLKKLVGVSRDMTQLTQYAHELLNKGESEEARRKHLTVTLDEMQKHASTLLDGLQKLVNGDHSPS